MPLHDKIQNNRAMKKKIKSYETRIKLNTKVLNEQTNKVNNNVIK